MATLTFIKDQALFRFDVTHNGDTFVAQEFFTDDTNSSKLGEVVAFVDTDGTVGTVDYILVGSTAVQFENGDTFSGDGGGTGIITSTPTSIGVHHVHVIQVDNPFTVVTIQEIVNLTREYEDELDQLDHPKIIDASGKQDLGGGVLVGITLELLDNWRVQFEARPGPIIESVNVTGGNIVASNIYNDNPIKPSPFTQVTVTSSSSATIAQLQIVDLVHRIESLRTSHAAFGKIIYWNPSVGDDLFLATSPDTAVKTFARAHDIADDEQGDVIFCLTKDSTGIVEVDEQIVITKNALSVRGPGEQFVFNDLSGTGDTITIQANHVALEGFNVQHDGTSANNGICIDGSVQGAEGCLLAKIVCRNINADAVTINDSGDSVIRDMFIEDCGGDGIQINDNVDDLRIWKCLIDRPVYGINVDGTAVLDTIIMDNMIHDCSQYGLRIGPGADQTIVRASTYFFDNIVGDIIEEVGSTNTNIEALEENQVLFGGSVHIDQSTGVAGTEFPIGTHTNPVNNFTDALTIAANNNLERLDVLEGTFVFTGAFDLDKFIITGSSPARSRLVFNDGTATTEKTVFERVFVGGIMNGDSMLARNCAVGSAAALPLSEWHGTLNSCAMAGDVICKVDGAEKGLTLIDCYTAGNQIPTIDANGDKQLTVRGYSGSVIFDGLDGTGIKTVGFLHGDGTFAASNGTADVSVSGVGVITNNATTITLDETSLMGQIIQDNNDHPAIFV